MLMRLPGRASRKGFGAGPEGDSMTSGEMERSGDGRTVGERRPRISTVQAVERAILVGIDLPRSRVDAATSLDELQQLALTAGAEVVGRITQKLDEPNSHYYLGKGKLEELAQLCEETGANLVVFDDELRPRVQQELEKRLELKVIDRTLLILDIFSRRARTHEGRVQVELAQYKYLLPRLIGMGTQLSRLGGGIGTRGPGETKLESDRRRIRQHITRLEKEIEGIRVQRQVHRGARQREELPVVALIGYTNVGKSTLLNSLTGSSVDAENKLFATLDPTTRKVRLPSGQEVLLTDTVGFISKLPTTLVAAFRATLEELQEADLLLRVVDITDDMVEESSRVVGEIVEELGLKDKPVITVLNKADRLLADGGSGGQGLEKMAPESLGLEAVPNTVLISAEKKLGLDHLLATIEETLNALSQPIEVVLPYSRGDLVDLFRRKGVLEVEEHTPEGTLLRGRLPRRFAAGFGPYVRAG